MMNFKRVLCGVAAACAMAPAGVEAQTAGDKPVSELSIEQLLSVEVGTVFGASRYGQRVIDAPAAVSIVTHEEIERFGYRTLGDVLRGVRGFYVTNDCNYSYLGVRGFSRPGDYNTRVLVLVDGHRLNETVYDSSYIGEDFPIPTSAIERVEVIRGPGFVDLRHHRVLRRRQRRHQDGACDPVARRNGGRRLARDARGRGALWTRDEAELAAGARRLGLCR